jgi:hypothetical protein
VNALRYTYVAYLVLFSTGFRPSLGTALCSEAARDSFPVRDVTAYLFHFECSLSHTAFCAEWLLRGSGVYWVQNNLFKCLG